MEYVLQLIQSFSGPGIYFIVFLILLGCGFGIPIPEDITLIAAGLVSYYGLSNVWIMLAVAFMGVMIGDGVIFSLGSRYGRVIAQRWPLRLVLTDALLDRVSAQLQKQGNKLIFAARFMPGLRAAIFFSAGTLKIPFRTFIFFDGLAALLSVPAIVLSTWYWGQYVDDVVRIVKSIEHGIVLVILCVVFYLILKWYAKSRRAKKNPTG